MNWEGLIVPLSEKHQTQKCTEEGAPQQKSQLLSSLLAVVFTHGELGPSLWTQRGSASQSLLCPGLWSGVPQRQLLCVQSSVHLSRLQNRDFRHYRGSYKSCCKAQWVVTEPRWCCCARDIGSPCCTEGWQEHPLLFTHPYNHRCMWHFRSR